MSRRLALVGVLGWSVVLGTAAYVYRLVGPPIPPRPRQPTCCPHP